ncbi:hypothetical protein [Azospirillum argentinense]|uniref:hypothetical protein n=1 Tax=Azospirillum argentinense TaxID=2970906 RepID=UPI0032DFA138
MEMFTVPTPEEVRRAFTTWDATTGRVVGVGFGQGLALPPLHPNWKRMADVQLDSLTQWIDPATEEVRERPMMVLEVSKTTIQPDGVDESIISGIPEGATVIAGNKRYTVTGGQLAFTSIHAGTYRLRIDAFPFQDAGVTVHAQD